MSIGYNYYSHNYHSLTNIGLVTMEGVVAGIFFPFMFTLFGARIGSDGVDYYGEIHTTALNSYWSFAWYAFCRLWCFYRTTDVI